MTMSDVRPAGRTPGDYSFRVQWGPVIAGALTAAALATVLHGFAAAIGLAVSSTAPTWRDASIALWLLSGVYLIAVALASYGLGGYIAGRLRERFSNVTGDELEARDGSHGLLVWAIATLLTALVIAWASTAATRLAAPSGGAPGAANSVGSENIIAYDLDKLLRADRRQGDPANLTYARSEAGRILLTSSSHSGVTQDDRAYLVRLVGAQTGLAQPDAEKRVEAAINSAKENIARARRSTVILAFMAAAAALLGAVAAWYAACAGGRHRDGDTVPSLTWDTRERPTTTIRS